MTERDSAGRIPTWDGQAKGWRRYTKEVAWYVSSTPVNKRRYVASKLISQLQGTARLLAMSWNRSEFDSNGGTLVLLRKLAASPLVRQTLPNTAAILQQYLSFKRRPGESMANFLVRETLGYEEFAEALQRLWEERNGVDPSEMNFGLPPEEEDAWETWWYDDSYDNTAASTTTADDTADPPVHMGQPPAEGERSEDQQPSGVQEEVRASMGSSPSHGRGGPPSVHSAAIQAPSTAGVSELSPTDSFIMGVLRGWRLLQAACLNAEETRDILSTTQNRLEFEAISKALQTLWDEQLLGQRYISSSASSNYGHVYMLQSWDVDTWHSDSWDTSSHDADWCGDAQWHEEWYDDWPWEEEHASSEPPTLAPVEEEDDQLKEAHQAEQAAEQLAMEAKCTCVEAQRTTQQMRKDRGFGQHGPPSTRCFNCGGNHFARDCPDKRVPPYSGKGGKNNHMMSYDDHQLYYTTPAKGKGKKGMKGKFKSAAVADQYALWTSKTKGKGKNFGKPVRPPVNAYTAFYDLGGLEMDPQPHFSAATAVKDALTSSTTGMLDCGATASAAPDLAVHGLIQAILAQDRGAKVDIQPYVRPFFRFGNGKWGQALYRATISSTVSGQHRSFSLFALPNPDDPSPNNLVPILIGMDHIGTSGCQMLVDFSLGYVIDGVDPQAELYQLKTNSKGHFVYDVVYHLTRGKSNQQGSAHVHVDRSEQQVFSSTLQFRPLEFYHSQVERKAPVNPDQRKELMWKLYDHVKSNAAAKLAHSMCSEAQLDPHVDISFRDHLRNGPKDVEGRAGFADRDRRHDSSQAQESISASRHESQDRDGPSRPKSSRDMAVLQPAPAGHLAEECSWNVATLRRVQCQDDLRAKTGRSKLIDTGNEPLHGPADACRAPAADAQLQANSSHLQGHDGQDHSGSPAQNSDHQRLEESSAGGRSSNQHSKGQGEAGRTINIVQPPQLGSSCGGGYGIGSRDADGREHRTMRSSSSTSLSSPSAKHVSFVESSSKTKPSSMCQNSSMCQDSSMTKTPTSLSSASMSKSMTKSMMSSRKPLPNNIAMKMMQMVAVMTSTLTSVALDASLEGRDGLWEVACSENSWLTAAANEHGIPSRRINFAQGYDIYKPETWMRLKEERRQRRPKKIWLSLPCTKFCKWTQVNYNTPERKEVLESMRRRERRMLRWVADFLVTALDEDPDLDVYWEWTYPCSGWQQGPMVKLEQDLQKRGIAWESCRIDGCNYGLMDSKNEFFLHKKWLIKTTDELFWKNFRAKVCPRNHTHSLIQGLETSRTAYYPKRMVESIVRHWKRQLAPLRHLKLLTSSTDDVIDEDENWERRLHPVLPQHDCRALQQEAMASESADADAAASSEAKDEQLVPPSSAARSLAAIPQKEQDAWNARLHHYHRTAGHPANRNLIHLFRDAGLPEWKLEMARQFRCAACEGIKLGGSSSGNVPPAATHETYKAWQAIGFDASEWLVPGQRVKIKFILYMDLATKLKVIHVAKEYSFVEMKAESTQDVITGFAEKWLCDKPKPEILIPDNAKTFQSREMHEFCNSTGIFLSFPAERESWAHGIVESAVKDVKMTA
jgi:ribonuclease HI